MTVALIGTTIATFACSETFSLITMVSQSLKSIVLEIDSPQTYQPN